MNVPSRSRPARGFRELQRLLEDGYEVVEVDSDDTFVGVRLARGDARAMVLLTREDFRSLFPRMPVGDRDGDFMPPRP